MFPCPIHYGDCYDCQYWRENQCQYIETEEIE